MKKLLAMLLLTMLGLGAISAKAAPVKHHYRHHVHHKLKKAHLKKDGTPDKRFKGNKKP